MKPFEEIATIVWHKPLGEDLFHLALFAPELIETAAPGQFVHILCGKGNLLRRPISICTTEGGLLQLIYAVRGQGTAWLSQRQAGETLSLLGPLGHGFSVEKLGERPIFVGGGIGVPPLLFGVQQAIHHGLRPIAILGFRSGGQVVLRHDFEHLCDTKVLTDDGSIGQKGFVTDALSECIGGASGIAACGPTQMLRAVAAQAQAHNVYCEVSLEERMACGIGACLVCTCGIKGADGKAQNLRVCKNGPVFDAREVLWSC